jgi:hypothetical protein
MQKSPLLRLVTILLLSTLNPPKSKKGSSGDQGSSTSDQPGSDGTDDIRHSESGPESVSAKEAELFSGFADSTACFR